MKNERVIQEQKERYVIQNDVVWDKYTDKPAKYTPKEMSFIDKYMETSNASLAYEQSGYTASNSNVSGVEGSRLLGKPKIQLEIRRRLKAAEAASQASAVEVLAFFASVMRGEVKDQFGLETSVADRIKAAAELAKRTVDIEQRAKGVADAKIEITLNWDNENK